MKRIGQTIDNEGNLITIYECPHCHWRTTGIKCLQNCREKIDAHHLEEAWAGIL